MVKSVCDQVGLRVDVFKGGNIARQVANGPRYWTEFYIIQVKWGHDQFRQRNVLFRMPMDIVVGSLGGLKKLFDQGYLRKNRVAEVGIDEVDSMLDDTFR